MTEAASELYVAMNSTQGGEVEVSVLGQAEVSTSCSSCRLGTAGPGGHDGAHLSCTVQPMITAGQTRTIKRPLFSRCAPQAVVG